MYIEDALVQVDVIPTESERFPFADAGSDEDFDEVGHERVRCVAVPQKDDDLVDGPGVAFSGCWSRDDRGPCGVVVEPVMPDGLAQGTREGGKDPVNSDRSTAPANWARTKAAMCPYPRSSSLIFPSAGMRSVSTYAR